MSAQLSFSEEAREKEHIRICHRDSSFERLLDDPSSVVIDANYSQLYIAIANEAVKVQGDTMQIFLFNNDRRAAWEIIAEGYRRCPLLVIRGLAFELNDATVYPPRLVLMARTCQAHHDGSFRIPLSVQDWVGEEILNERDISVLRWWLAYLQLDAEEWQLALQTLMMILEDCNQGRWPSFYLSEVLYLSAVAGFGMDSRELCLSNLERYFTVACMIDRNIADAKLLLLWATRPSIPPLYSMCHQAIANIGTEAQKEELVSLHGTLDLLPDTGNVPELKALDEKLQAVWGDDMFRNHSWIRVKVTRALGIETYEQRAYEHASNALLQSWANMSSSKWKSNAEAVAKRIRDGGTVTVRYTKKERRN